MPKRSANPTQQLNRRHFLGQSTAVAAAAAVFPAIVPASALGRARAVAPGDRINLGVIGFGPRCKYDLTAMLKDPEARFVAVCDVQADRREAGKQLVDAHYGNSDCASLHDFQELLARPDIDALLIATGDRWHGPASIMAAKAGKDVYSEKPCGLTIDLCLKLAQTMKETGRIFQAGTQRRSVPNFQAAVALARSGKLGKLHTLHASIYTPKLDNSWLPAEPTPPKDQVDWERWLGPAPWRPFNKLYVQGGWRGYWDFDSGARLLDWGAHTLDLCQQANNADDTMPTEYVPSDKGIVAHYANGPKIVLDFLETPFGDRPGWINELGTCPVRFEGDEGSVETGDNGGIVVKPASLQTEVDKLLSASAGSGLDVSAHARNFFDCIKSRQPTAANPEIMKRSHIACHAAALSWVLKRKLRLDPETFAFIDDDEANSLRSRPAREPWNV